MALLVCTCIAFPCLPVAHVARLADRGSPNALDFVLVLPCMAREELAKKGIRSGDRQQGWVGTMSKDLKQDFVRQHKVFVGKSFRIVCQSS